MAIDVEFTTPPDAPSSSDASTFRTRSDAFVAYIVALITKLIAFVTQINATESNINAKEASAIAASEAAVGAANYQGDWVAGSYSKGVSVSKDGFRYVSKINLNTDVPPSANWEVVGTKAELAQVIHSATEEIPGDTDELSYWDSFTLALRKVSISSLKTIFAPLNSPALTGNPTAPTPSVGDNDNSIATTAFVQGEKIRKFIASYELADGVAAGATTANVAALIPINTIKLNEIGASLAGGVITLPAGNYNVFGIIKSVSCGSSNMLCQKSDGTLLSLSMQTVDTVYVADSPLIINDRFSLASPAGVEFMVIGTAGGTLGRTSARTGVPEVYATITIEKVV